jgi:hypothetical protein
MDMSEDKSYLNDLVDYVKENYRKRGEEVDSLNPESFRNQLKQKNPNIPDDDINAYQQNVKDDLGDNLMGSAMAPSLGKAGLSAIERAGSKLPEVSRFRELMDSNIMRKIKEPFTQQRNIDMTNRAAEEMANISKANKKLVPEMELPKVDEFTEHANYKNWLKDKNNDVLEQDYGNKAEAIQNLMKDNEIMFKGMDENTIPAVPQELIDAVLKKKSNQG